MNQSSVRYYFFILGSHPAISAAEILAYFETNKYDFSVLAAGYDYLIINTKNQIESNILDFIGGSIKFGKIEKIFQKFPSVEEIYDILPAADKIFFGLSLYPVKVKNKQIKNIFRIGLDLKKYLKEKNRTARLVTSKQDNLSAVVVVKNKLLGDNGAEIVIINQQQNYFLGKTLDVQPFVELSKRDYGRPQRDDRSGMLPPKLAQIMLNLSQTDKYELILDPFCGSGTVLQEALWQKRTNLIGSDISDKAISNTRKNLTWLGQEYNLSVNNIKLVKTNVVNLPKFIKPNSVGAVVTEPDLGRTDLKPSNQLAEEARLKNLYIQSYEVFYNLLKSKGLVVMIWPVFFNTKYLDIEKIVEKIGYKKIIPLSKDLLNNYQLNKRNNLQYARSGQKVAREITIWQKV